MEHIKCVPVLFHLNEMFYTRLEGAGFCETIKSAVSEWLAALEQ
jgi:hypothetical protein